MGLVDELQKLDDLRRRGTLTDAEFEQAKAVLLAGGQGPADQPLDRRLADQLDDIRHQNELAQIDRNWEIERQQYLVASRYGHRQVPTSGMGLGSAIVGGVFGAIWTVGAVSITISAPDFGPFAVAKFAFPLFGIVFTLTAIGWGVRCYLRAQQYEAAFRAYQVRRGQASPEQFPE